MYIVYKTQIRIYQEYQLNICLDGVSNKKFGIIGLCDNKATHILNYIDHLTCLLRNLYAGQEATVRTGHGTTDWFQIGKGDVKAVYCHSAYLTYLQSKS